MSKKPPFKTMRKRVQFVTKLTCQSCGYTQDYCHHGCHTKEEAFKEMPTERWNGWDLKKGICYGCRKKKGLK